MNTLEKISISITRKNRNQFKYAVALLVLLIIGSLIIAVTVQAEVTNIERLSLGTGSVEANRSSYFAYLSETGRYAAFESWASNWAPDGKQNYVDIFIRDRQADITSKINYPHTGESADDDSFDPIMSADGRYIVYNSYATNLVPNDNNKSDWLRDGLDVFLYDKETEQTWRVSVQSDGGEISGNSVGTITPDGRYVIFASNGQNIVPGGGNSERRTALYLRNWRTGTIERITHGIDGQFPNDGLGGARASYDGRYIVYKSASSNLVANDTNGVTDVFLYDHETGKTIRVSESPSGGNANGASTPVEISSDGQYIVFRSAATNLVVGDTNGERDIFVYSVATGEIRRVNVSESGQQANADSRDPSICGNGRYVSFTSEATNLVPGDTNNQRDVFLADLETNEMFIVTINDDGVWGNGKAHRSNLSANCRAVAFATEATNMVPNDTNESRDLFVSEIIRPADLSSSVITSQGSFEPGQTITYFVTLRNTGTEPVVGNIINPIPDDTDYILLSFSGTGGSYNSALDRIEWSGDVPGESEVTISYAVVIDGGAADFTIITNQAVVSGDGQNRNLTHVGIVNGLKTYLPIVAQD